MLRDGKGVRVDEALCTLDHVERLLEALGLDDALAGGDDAVGLVHVGAVLGGVAHALDVGRVVDEVDTLAGRADGLEMAEGFTHPVHDAALLDQRLHVRTAGDEDGVEERGTHAFEVVVGLHALAGLLAFAVGKDVLALRADGEGHGARALECSDNAVVGDWVVAVRDQNGDAARDDRGRFRLEVSLRESSGLLAVVETKLLRRCGSTGLLSNCLRETEVNHAKALGHAVVDEGIIAVVKLER